jgi:hypothetical protein
MDHRLRSFWLLCTAVLVTLSLLPPTSVQSNEPPPVPAATPAQAVQPADWPLSRYDSGRSSHNAGEQELAPPLVQNIPASFNFVEPDAIIQDSMLIVGDTGYLSLDEDDSYTVRAVDLGNVQDNTARELWRYGGDETIDQPLRDLAIGGDLLLVRQLVSFLEGSLVALDRTTGAVRWRRSYRTEFGAGGTLILAHTVDGTRTFFLEQSGQQHALVALATATGQELWRQTLPEGSYTNLISTLQQSGRARQ